LSVHLHITPLINYFEHLMYRQYVSDDSVWGGGRPQFLFAEPSYIGMHLFGILLPLMWLMRRCDRIYAKRLRDLIVVYAIGAVLMQAGTRIILDSVVALLIAIVVHNTWHDKRQRLRGVAQLFGACGLGLLGILADSRLSSIAENGAEGDGSFFARIYQSLDPLCGLAAHPWTVLTGYGAGNIINAMQAGAAKAEQLLNNRGMNGEAALNFATGSNADNVWTMCAYTSVVTEYGLIGLALLVVASVACAARIRNVRALAGIRGAGIHGGVREAGMHGSGAGAAAAVVEDDAAWQGGWRRKTVVCWFVLLVYLYIQCENYAFAALPLFIFAARRLHREG